MFFRNIPHYWEKYKKRHAQQAEEIEAFCYKDMTALSDKDAYETVKTICRWSKDWKVPVREIKQKCVENFKSRIFLESIMQIHETLVEGKAAEAQKFKISPENTSYTFMMEILDEIFGQLITWRLLMSVQAPTMNKFSEVYTEYEQINKVCRFPPDISHLNREENRLFILAGKGVELFHSFKPLTKKGRVEAIILCSVCVIDLHSHLTYDIELDVQADRYFLLLFQNIQLAHIEITPEFINSRTAFYNHQRADWAQLSPSAPFQPNNPTGLIYNALYVYPCSEDAMNMPPVGKIEDDEMEAFNLQLAKVFKAMEDGKNKILRGED